MDLVEGPAAVEESADDKHRPKFTLELAHAVASALTDEPPPVDNGITGHASNQGKYEESCVTVRGPTELVTSTAIEFQYEVHDHQYTNNDIANGGKIRSGRTYAEKQQAKFPEGSTHTVFCNPDNAREAYLEPVVEWRGRLELLGGVVATIVGVLLITGLIGQ